MTQLVTKGHQIYVGHVLDQFKGMPDNWVQCVVTSPPYFGLRNYGTATWQGGDSLCSHSPGREGWAKNSTLQGSKDTQDHRMDGFPGNTCPKCGATRVDLQIGHEDTPNLYVEKLVQVFEEVRRVLRPDGVCWLNLGDSYWGSWGNSGNRPQLDGESKGQRERSSEYLERPGYDDHRRRPASSYKVAGLKNKDLVGIPWMTALALRKAGWWLRSEIIWAKKNCMPESVEDRPAKSHEHIFMLTKSADYFYDHEAVKERSEDPDRVRNDKFGGNKYQELHNSPAGVFTGSPTRNRRDVWHLSTVPSQIAHFATFPPQIPLTCILASTSAKVDEPQIVLDPFHGSGTTGAVAEYLGRRYVGIELNPDYVELYDARCAEVRRAIVGGDAPDRQVKEGQISLFEDQP